MTGPHTSRFQLQYGPLHGKMTFLPSMDVFVSNVVGIWAVIRTCLRKQRTHLWQSYPFSCVTVNPYFRILLQLPWPVLLSFFKAASDVWSGGLLGCLSGLFLFKHLSISAELLHQP